MQANSKNNNERKATFIEKQLSKIDVEKLSKESEFSKRKAKKITAKDFLLGFFLMANSRENNTYENWAIKIGWIIRGKVSKQAIWKKMQEEQIVFLKKVLSSIMKDSLIIKRKESENKPLERFKNVIVEDSTSIKLDKKLYSKYPGNGYSNKKDKTSIMKIQAAYSLTKRKFLRLAITSFRKNDQGYSPKIIEIAKRGDLIIRDLGYFALEVFKKFNKEGIYYISRLRKKVNIFRRKDETVIDLAKMLKKRGSLDMEILLGENEKLPVRLIALPVEEEVANQRRRKAKTNRDKRCSPNKEHLYLLGWELFITNVNKNILSSAELAQLYFIRWRIETIFKTWKSYFKIVDIPKDASKVRTESYIYSMLIFITLFQVHFYNYILAETKKKLELHNSREFSLIKLMQFVTKNIEFVLLCGLKNYSSNENFLLGQLSYYCIYESRNDRFNYCQKFLMLS
jgi:hypothetical protein